MESDMSATLLENKDVPLGDTLDGVGEKVESIDLHEGHINISEIDDNKEQFNENDKSCLAMNDKADIIDTNLKVCSELEPEVAQVSEKEGKIDTPLKENLSKSVGIGDAEEGELDYEEEAPEEDHQMPHEEQRADQEEGELLDEKEVACYKEAEGSEEGEIVSDDEDYQKTNVKKEDKEEGEINDDDLEEGQLDEELDKGPRPRVLCKYYEAGTCRWGITCRFLHPGINDKGNYVMHRPVGMYPTAFGKPPPPSELGPLNNMVQRGPPVPMVPSVQLAGFGENALVPFELEMQLQTQPRKETAWERGLKKAKEIKLTSVKRREEDENFEEKKLNLSIKENETENERPAVVRREPWRHAVERDNQPGPRPRPVEQRPDINDRRFNRNRKSPPRRYEPERERGNRSHDHEREKPRDMDRERYLRMRRTPTPPERQRGRDRDRDQYGARRDKRNETREKSQRSSQEISQKVQDEKTEITKEEPKKEIKDTTKDDIQATVPAKVDAEQWVDPWMRRQPQPNRSPSPVRKDDDVSSIGSSGSGDGESDSEGSDESGSDSESDSRESSDVDENKDIKAKVADSGSAAGKEAAEQATDSVPKDPRFASVIGSESGQRVDSPQSVKSGRSSEKGHSSRSARDDRDTDRKRHNEASRRVSGRGNESDRRHRRDRYPPSSIPSHTWQGQSSVEAQWPRTGFNQYMGNGYRGDDRMRRPEEDPRLKSGRHMNSRRPSLRSPRSSSHSHRRDPRSSSKDESERRRLDGNRTSPRRMSPKQRDPRLADPEKTRKRDNEYRFKEGKPDENKMTQVKESSKRSDPRDTSEVDAVKSKDNKTDGKKNSDVSEDEFQSPKYGGSGSGSDSESESGSESESESGAASDSASGSASGSGSEKSGSESEGEGSESDSEDNSGTSGTDASPSRKKEIEKIKKDFKMVLNQAKNLSSSQRTAKSQSSTSSKDSADQRFLAGQKRPSSGQASSTASPKTGPSKTSARKDELLKELKAIEDAIARKRAKID